MQNALMTFEEDKFQQATLLLKDMERECAGDIGWLKSVKSKVFRAEETDVSSLSRIINTILFSSDFSDIYLEKWSLRLSLIVTMKTKIHLRYISCTSDTEILI